MSHVHFKIIYVFPHIKIGLDTILKYFMHGFRTTRLLYFVVCMMAAYVHISILL